MAQHYVAGILDGIGKLGVDIGFLPKRFHRRLSRRAGFGSEFLAEAVQHSQSLVTFRQGKCHVEGNDAGAVFLELADEKRIRTAGQRIRADLL